MYISKFVVQMIVSGLLGTFIALCFIIGLEKLFNWSMTDDNSWQAKLLVFIGFVVATASSGGLLAYMWR